MRTSQRTAWAPRMVPAMRRYQVGPTPLTKSQNEVTELATLLRHDNTADAGELGTWLAAESGTEALSSQLPDEGEQVATGLQEVKGELERPCPHLRAPRRARRAS